MEAVFFSASQKQEIKYVNEQKERIPFTVLWARTAGLQVFQHKNSSPLKACPHEEKETHPCKSDWWHVSTLHVYGRQASGGDHLLNLLKSRNVAEKTTQVNENTDSFAITWGVILNWGIFWHTEIQTSNLFSYLFVLFWETMNYCNVSTYACSYNIFL